MQYTYTVYNKDLPPTIKKVNAIQAIFEALKQGIIASVSPVDVQKTFFFSSSKKNGLQSLSDTFYKLDSKTYVNKQQTDNYLDLLRFEGLELTEGSAQ